MTKNLSKKVLAGILILLLCLTAFVGVTVARRNTAIAESSALSVWSGSKAEDFESGTGVEGDPFIIKNGEQLELLSYLIRTDTATISARPGVSNAYYVTAHYKLESDIKLNDTTNWENWNKSSLNEDLSLNAWQPIGWHRAGSLPIDKPFKGVFDGNDKTIYGMLSVYSNTTVSIGLFGYIQESTVKNVTVKESFVWGASRSGVIVGRAEGSASARCTISNCHNYGNFTAVSKTADPSVATQDDVTCLSMGGVVGQAMSTDISDCHNEGRIKGSNSDTGGVVGWLHNGGTLSNSYNTGDVTTEYAAGINHLGGLVGLTGVNVSIIGCYNTGNVAGGENYIGGLIGDLGEKKNPAFVDGQPGKNIVKDCYNTGSVSGKQSYIGGLIGRSSPATFVDNCYNTGTVKSNTGAEVGTVVSSNVGGLIGLVDGNASDTYAGEIKNSYNNGDVSNEGKNAVNAFVGGANTTGGLFGGLNQKQDVKNCYNSGNVLGTDQNTGGIAGFAYSVKIQNCMNSGAVTQRPGAYYGYYVGGVVGFNNSATIENTYYLQDCAEDGDGTKQFGVGAASKGATVADVADKSTAFEQSSDKGDGKLVTDASSLLTVLNSWVATEGVGYNAWYVGKTEGSYPTFQDVIRYTLTYNSNFGTITSKTQIFIEGDDQALETNTFTRANYVFSHWNTASDGTGTTYTDGQTGVVLTGNLTLYAQWQSPHTHIFDAAKWESDATGHWHKCTAADCPNASDKLDFAAHTFGGWSNVTAPTCEADGSKVRACTVCNHSETVVVPKTGHDVDASTWVTNGAGHWHACSHDASERIDYANHSWDDNNNCSVCGVVREVVTITIQGSDNDQTLTVDKDTQITVKANPPQGKVFKHWVDGDNNVLSEDAEYTFAVGTTMSISAVYEDPAVICYVHWIILVWILLFIVACLLWQFLLRNNFRKLIAIITLCVYGAGNIVLSIFCGCTACTVLIVIAWVLLVAALLWFILAKYDKEPEEIKTVEEWLDEERDNLKVDKNKNDPLAYINAKLTKAKEENHVTALNILKDEYSSSAAAQAEAAPQEQPVEPAVPVKTVEEWLDEERSNIDAVVENENDPLAYVRRVLKTAKEENRVTALNILLGELIAEDEKEKERMAAEAEAAKKEAEDDLADESDIVDDTEDDTDGAELEERKAQAETERKAFIAAKKSGAAVIVPALGFTLSREDVLDFVEGMKNMSECPVEPRVSVKEKKHYPDSLNCGEWCFALMYEKSNVIKFILRCDEETFNGMADKYTAVKTARFPGGTNWYDVIVDSSFSSKKEVFDILMKCYLFVIGKYYEKKGDTYVTDTKAAALENDRVVSDVKTNASVVDETYNTAIAEREISLEAFKSKHRLAFKMSRARMLAYSRKAFEDGEVLDNSRWYLPARLKSKKKTFVMVYEKKGEVSLTVRISDDYADFLAARHPEVRRARFPKGRNWYIVPVDGSFPNAQMVYRVLKRAKKFVEADAKKKTDD